MASFKEVLIRNIRRKAFTREYYEKVIATWQLYGWLTEAEAKECLQVLNEVYPQTAQSEA